MRPYRRHTAMRLRFVRRLRYGRGHGIHSPRAYALVQSLIRPRHGYYTSVSGVLNALLYRIVARLHPSLCFVDGEVKIATDTVRLVSPQIMLLPYETPPIHQSETALLLTDDASRALDFIRSSDHERYVLLLDIRANHSKYKAFKTLSVALSHGTLIDLYECAILYNGENERYIYRSSL